MRVLSTAAEDGETSAWPWAAMSWSDCHLGYSFIGLACLVIAVIIESFALGIIAFAAMLNGGYAAGFTARPDGDYSSFLWWLALPTSFLVLFIATMLELNRDELRIGVAEIVALCIAGKLAIGQLMFLFRRRHERFESVFAEETSNI